MTLPKQSSLAQYEEDFEFGKSFMLIIKPILLVAAVKFNGIEVQDADFELDAKQATDALIMGTIKQTRFAIRMRRPGVFWGRSFNSPTPWGLQFTIRSARDTQVETELSKIKRGMGHLFFYGHAEAGKIRCWIVLNLNIFRAHCERMGVRYEIQDNKDGTHFCAYDIRSFPPEIIVDISTDMAIALKSGVDAVAKPESIFEMESNERIHKRMEKAPDLQEWVAKAGGYHLIDWKAWDHANAQWQFWRRQRTTF